MAEPFERQQDEGTVGRFFGRGSREVLDIFPGREVDNDYDGNIVDLCPVGALTDKDFRFRVRSWYLDQQISVCDGCSTGCAITASRFLNLQARVQGVIEPKKTKGKGK